MVCFVPSVNVHPRFLSHRFSSLAVISIIVSMLAYEVEENVNKTDNYLKSVPPALSGFLDLDAETFAEHAECGLKLVEPGGVEHVEQPGRRRQRFYRTGGCQWYRGLASVGTYSSPIAGNRSLTFAARKAV
jgi:hypothetical protein